MNDMRIKRVTVVATGVIGASWVAYFLAKGLTVVGTDPSPGAEARLHDAVKKYWPVMKEMGLSENASLENLSFEADLEAALQGADFVQENGPEREDFKIELFRRMDAVLPANVILASSSSGLLVTRMQSACRHPERVVLGHPFNPAHMIPLVEVIGGEKTSAETIERTMMFYAAIGKRPIHARKEIKGHIANRLQAALWREAFHLVEQGVATVSDIDTAITYGPGLRWALTGPFMNLHLSGGEDGIAHTLAHLGPPIEDWWRDLGAPMLTADLTKKVIEGMSEEIGERDMGMLQAERDALLLDLLRAKSKTNHLG
jgi:3-hydroxyacyl-CoA dehydrogenase